MDERGFDRLFLGAIRRERLMKMVKKRGAIENYAGNRKRS
jgi:hypothetical protein